MNSIPQWLSTIVLVGAAFAVLAKAVSWIVSFVSRIVEFLDDWRGEPERPGVSPERPGVMKRIARLEQVQTDTHDAVRHVEHEVVTNGGTSIKDQITRIEEHNVPLEARSPTPS